MADKGGKMRDLKNIGESRIRQIQRKRNQKRIDCEFVVVMALATIGMVALVINW